MVKDICRDVKARMATKNKFAILFLTGSLNCTNWGIPLLVLHTVRERNIVLVW